MNFFDEFKDLAEAAPSDTLGPAGLSDTLEFRNPVCGDRIWVSASFQDGHLSTLGYRVQGCWPVKGCMELLQQRYLRQPPENILNFSLEDFLLEVEDVPTSKRHAFSLAHRGVSAVVLRTWLEEKAGCRPDVRLV